MSTPSDIPQRFTTLCNSVSEMAAAYQIKAVNAWLYTLNEAMESFPAKRKKLQALKPFLLKVGRTIDTISQGGEIQPITPTRQEIRLLDTTIVVLEETIKQIENNFAIDAHQLIKLINKLITE